MKQRRNAPETPTWSGSLQNGPNGLRGQLELDGWLLLITALREASGVPPVPRTPTLLWISADVAARGEVSTPLHHALLELPHLRGDLEQQPDGTWSGEVCLHEHRIALTATSAGPGCLLLRGSE